MGNGCITKKKKEPLLKIVDLMGFEQITIRCRGDCVLCDRKDIEGFESKSVLKKNKIFVCLNCKT